MAELVGISRRSVHRIEQEAPILAPRKRGSRAAQKIALGGGARRGQREEMLPLLKRHEVQVLRRAGLRDRKSVV